MRILLSTEVIADVTKAIDVVLLADTKRLELLEEEKRLTKLNAEGHPGSSERLKEVCFDCIFIFNLTLVYCIQAYLCHFMSMEKSHHTFYIVNLCHQNQSLF